MISQILKREIFETDRTLEFFSEKELQMQIGYPRPWWPVAMVKELIDNSLDACETAGILPEIVISLEKDAVSIQDNGPGLPDETIDRSLDYLIRVSDKSHYVSPSRGQLGNALKCVYAAPFVMNGEHGHVEILTGGKCHSIDVSLNRIAQRPELQHTVTEDSFVKNGTFIKINISEIAGLLKNIEPGNFYNSPINLLSLISWYGVFNPHASFIYHGVDYKAKDDRSLTDFFKWSPSHPTFSHWYTVERMRDLIAGYVNLERNGARQKTVREFVSEFKGLSSTGKQKQVTDACGFSRSYLHDFIEGEDISNEPIERLLRQMNEHSKPVKPKALGVIGEDHFKRWMGNGWIASESVKYKSVYGESEGLPFVLEVAFGVNTEEYKECEREVITGLNWSPTLQIPFEILSRLLGEARVDSWDPVSVVVHLACPRLDFTDRGKSKLQLPFEIEDALEKAVKSVTKQFTAAKRKADRENRLYDRQLEELQKTQRKEKISVKDAAYEVMEQAYLKASGNNTLPANARQIMYAARPLIIEMTGETRPWSDSSYFTQNLLPDFLEANPELTSKWDVVYDARGKLVEPHTQLRVDLGTIDVRRYVNAWENEGMVDEIGYITLPHHIETSGPHNRYKYVLFVEKEGFDELWKSAKLANRYDLAMMSTKGMSVTASRTLVARLTEQGVTILVLHDFDKAGFSIVHTLGADTKRFKYKTPPNVIDLGLRLEDVVELESEDVEYSSKKDPRVNLSESGATEEELNFLVNGGSPGRWKGKRVEINAMDSSQLLQWVESKLQAAGIHKVIPDNNILEKAYRRAHKISFIEDAIREARKNYNGYKVHIPGNLQTLVEQSINSTELPWDEALYQILCDKKPDEEDVKWKH
ncbi:hypothetical protein ACFL1Z_03025 [Thermodesulfobacteriota bacterium]